MEDKDKPVMDSARMDVWDDAAKQEAERMLAQRTATPAEPVAEVPQFPHAESHMPKAPIESADKPAEANAAEQAAWQANLATRHEQRLENLQGAVENRIFNNQENLQVAEAAVEAQTEVIPDIESDIKAQEDKVQELSEQSRGLGWEVKVAEDKIKILGMQEEQLEKEMTAGLERISKEAVSERKSIEIQTEIAILDLEAKGREEVKPLLEMAIAQQEEARAGGNILGETKGDEQGITAEKQKDLEHFIEPGKVQEIMQQTVGGEISVDLTKADIAKREEATRAAVKGLMDGVDEKKQQVTKEEDEKMKQFSKQIEQRRTEIRAKAEAARTELDAARAKKAEADDNLEQGQDKLGDLEEEKREVSEKIDELRTEVVELRKNVEKDVAMLESTIEKISEVKKEGETAVGALLEMGKAIGKGEKVLEDRLKKGKNEVDDAMRVRWEASSAAWSRRCEAADNAYTEGVKNLSDELVNNPDLGIAREKDGILAVKGKDPRSLKRGAEALNAASDRQDVLEAECNDTKKHAGEFWEIRQEGIAKDRVLKVAALEREAGRTKAQYEAAMNMVNTMSVVAEKVFGPATEKPSVVSFLKGVGGLIAGAFGRKKE